MRKYKPIEPNFTTAFSSELRRARELCELTLVDISAKIGVHYGQLSRFESGNFKVFSPNLQEFAKLLRVRLVEPTMT